MNRDKDRKRAKKLETEKERKRKGALRNRVNPTNRVKECMLISSVKSSIV